MKSFLGFLFFLCIALPMAAEKKPQHAVYTEFGGISNTFSVSYDTRFHGNKGVGYSVGLGYGGQSSPFLGSQQRLLHVRWNCNPPRNQHFDWWKT